MKFWDASAIVPLPVAEDTTDRLQALAQRDPDMLAWWASVVECASAPARLQREAALDPKGAALAFQRLAQIADAWHEIEPSEFVRENAVRFLRVHPLRAADALQLAAAFVAAERRPPTLRVIALDDRLADAMRKEGFALNGLRNRDLCALLFARPRADQGRDETLGGGHLAQAAAAADAPPDPKVSNTHR